jgi:hypothetical protein
MQRPQPKGRKIWAVIASGAAALGLMTLLPMGHAQAQSTPPATTLGIWTSAEDDGGYSTIAGQSPNVANTYLYWRTAFPTSFADQAESAGATPFVEIEPWQGVTQGNSGDCGYSSNFPAMTTIGANGSAITSYLDSFGSAIASFGHPVIVTFAHEFNVSGQYPWAQDDCEGTTAAQWIKAWDTVKADIEGTAGGLAYFMWAPGANTGGTTIDPTPYWPGSSEVDMIGVDGYPDTEWGSRFGTFSGLLGPVFSEIHALTSLPIFIAETDLAPLDGSGYESLKDFISDLCSSGGDGVLQFQDGTAAMSSTQWTELDNALSSDCGSGSGGGGGSPSTSPSSSPSSTGGSAGSGGCANAAPATAPGGFKADVQGSYAVLSWNAVSTATEYEVMVTLPDGDEWRDNIATTTSATYDVVPTTGTYTYQVRAVNSVGNGPWSSTQNFIVTQ